ncbi:MAG: nucleotide exchange factor GrpE [Magnetococcus sp. DMHC-1]|nr:nucleotide exchange factor GrpE [Magnetococcales bacterium]
MQETQELLLEQFRVLLEQSKEEDVPTDSVVPDLQALFIELVALKNEVRIESRQVKSALDQFRQVFELVDGSQKSLQRELERTRDEEQGRLRSLLKKWLLEMLEVRDRMEAGLAAMESHRLPRLVRWFSPGEAAWLESMRAGQTLVLKRLDAMLAARQVRAIPAIGEPLDPHCMRAVATAWQEGVAEGVVIEEARKGFFWENDILRLAEVKVNRREGESND